MLAHHVNDAFYPITSQIWHAAGFTSSKSAEARFDKLEAMIARSGLEAEDNRTFPRRPALHPRRSAIPPSRNVPGRAEGRDDRRIDRGVRGVDQDFPVLALLEDAHWIDPTSLDVFGRVVDRLPSLRALLVIAFRSEFAAPWFDRAHVASLPLSRFSRRQALAMVDRITGGKALPAEVLEQIVAKTDGAYLLWRN